MQQNLQTLRHMILGLIITALVIYFIYSAIKKSKLQSPNSFKDLNALALVLKANKSVYKELKDIMLKQGDTTLAEPIIRTLSDKEKQATVKAALLAAIESFMLDNYLDEHEQQIVEDYCKLGGFTTNELADYTIWQRATRSAIVRKIREGKFDEINIHIDGNLPVIFKKDEQLLWIFQNVECKELKTKSMRYGSTMHFHRKGSYVGYGTFTSMSHEYKEWSPKGTGLLIITTQHLYFTSAPGNAKYPYDKLLSIEPYTDGLIIQKDNTTAKPTMFKGADGVFIYNVINNL